MEAPGALSNEAPQSSSERWKDIIFPQRREEWMVNIEPSALEYAHRYFWNSCVALAKMSQEELPPGVFAYFTRVIERSSEGDSIQKFMLAAVAYAHSGDSALLELIMGDSRLRNKFNPAGDRVALREIELKNQEHKRKMHERRVQYLETFCEHINQVFQQHSEALLSRGEELESFTIEGSDGVTFGWVVDRENNLMHLMVKSPEEPGKMLYMATAEHQGKIQITPQASGISHGFLDQKTLENVFYCFSETLKLVDVSLAQAVKDSE